MSHVYHVDDLRQAELKCRKLHYHRDIEVVNPERHLPRPWVLGGHGVVEALQVALDPLEDHQELGHFPLPQVLRFNSVGHTDFPEGRYVACIIHIKEFLFVPQRVYCLFAYQRKFFGAILQSGIPKPLHETLRI
uniref:Uncharacterized protein n=1 Tax=Clastoptera arizonana TaxID=38151 RepID=A0A1B6CKY9_9HEMI